MPQLVMKWVERYFERVYIVGGLNWKKER